MIIMYQFIKSSPIIIATIIGLVFSSWSSAQTLRSTEQQTLLLELYTSEGCSSCPSADRWLSTLKDDNRLWTQIVPVAFHVDYWDYIGWKDRFANAKYSMRQRHYAINGNARSVYTPGFFQNGKEWSRWFRNKNINPVHTNQAGVLHADIAANKIKVSFKPGNIKAPQLLLHIAMLGFDIETEVKAGENDGKKLHHDFVALTWKTFRSNFNNVQYYWEIDRAVLVTNNETAMGIALWVTRADDPTPLQAIGGWLS
jgi:hypothetical protein